MRVFRQLTNLPAFKNCILTIGTFDGVHLGHQKILQRLDELRLQRSGESLLVTFEPHPRNIIDSNQPLRLLSPLDEKLVLLEQFGVQNVVVVPFTAEFADQSANDYIDYFLVDVFSPCHIIVGYDHRYGKNREGGLTLLQQKSATAAFVVEEIPKQLVDDIAVSSTKIRQALALGKVEEANHLLGYPYRLHGTVEKGYQIGRSIGFPTANIVLHDINKLLPANGVYAIKVVFQNRIYSGMLNIGIRPTFDGNRLSIEAHLFDFEGDLYGQSISVNLFHYIRSERKFENTNALIQQLQQDKHTALNVLESSLIV